MDNWTTYTREELTRRITLGDVPVGLIVIQHQNTPATFDVWDSVRASFWMPDMLSDWSIDVAANVKRWNERFDEIGVNGGVITPHRMRLVTYTMVEVKSTGVLPSFTYSWPTTLMQFERFPLEFNNGRPSPISGVEAVFPSAWEKLGGTRNWRPISRRGK